MKFRSECLHRILIYLFDNVLQCSTAMEDIEYAKWLDPDRVPCYVRDDDE